MEVLLRPSAKETENNNMAAAQNDKVRSGRKICHFKTDTKFVYKVVQI